MVSHQASVPIVASVNVGKDSQTAAIDTFQDHIRHLTEQIDVFPSRQARDGLSVNCCSGAASIF